MRFASSALIGIVGAQMAPAQAQFDVVSIKRYEPKRPPYEACNARHDAVILTLTGCTLKHLVTLAYDLRSYQLAEGGAAWMETESYVIQARSSAAASQAEMMKMLQPALAGRFHLAVEWQSRPGSVYLLTVAARGLKLQPASKTTHCGQVNVRKTTFQADCLTMDDFAEALGQFAFPDRPVVNQTGLSETSQYEFKLNFSLTDEITEGPSMLSALPDQLGLNLKAGTAPRRTLVIRDAQRPLPD